ncbi:DNA recombination protein RmuC [Aestuariispira insulae]|uniref:DNA recombination protein RmuC homolog n=1 Tax=Aestuariispira insulae TaxID=1461337 RepID=A0A3D9H6H5_9PROT|nr:DNA recombination protein RmuC [Aestuariispira insulae]RED45113.1 DNA recombination protein RmuC [Aestuariispira insulae]
MSIEWIIIAALGGISLLSLVGLILQVRRTPATVTDPETLRDLVETQTRLEHLEGQLEEAHGQLRLLDQSRDQLRQQVSELQTALALSRQEVAEAAKRLSDWDEFKKQAQNTAQAATIEAANKLSSKLLEDHKRENEEAKKEAEKRVAETTKTLTEQLSNVVKSVAALDSQVKVTDQTMNVLHRALSAPSTAGLAAETVLENTLKAFGLTEGRDFSLQHTVDDGDGKRKRPDALVFLPGDSLLVIDAKASKHLLDLAEAEEKGEDTARIHADFKSTMGKHLRDLTTRDYAQAIRNQFKDMDTNRDIRQVTTFMFLPNDGAVEKLIDIDPEIAQKAAASDIILGGPSSLWAAVGVASMRLKFAKSQENQQKIVDEVEKLVAAIATMAEHGTRLGNGLKTALSAFDKMAGSVNRNILPKASRMVQMGVSAPAKGLDSKFPRLSVQTDAIDADVSPAEERINGGELPLLKAGDD